MSVTIYMTVTVEDEQVKPVVHVSSFQTSASLYQGGQVLRDIPLHDVRFGLEVAKEVLEFAERLKQESS